MRAMKQSKYRNRKTTINGITFDSAKEAERYGQLISMQNARHIRNLRLQPSFTLEEAYKTADTGETVRALRYVADFSYEEPVGRNPLAPDYWRLVVEDVKGKKTKEYELKKKLMLNRNGIRIREI